MDFLMINSVNNYVKNMDLQNKWKIKKDTNDFSKTPLNELQRKNESFKKSYLEKKDDEKDKETLTAIYNKIYSGAKLTPDEMKYLQVKNPEMYKKLKDIENEKKQYERELKECKTKEDVEKLKFSKVSASLSAINSVKNNPNIPESFKLEVAMREQKRLNELDKITAKFVKSGEYAKLPTEAEKSKAEHDVKEAEKAETEEILKKDVQTETADKSENTIKDKNTENIDNADKSAVQASKADVKVTETENADNEKVFTKEKKMTRTEAELTPEARKVKRSKAKAAYVKSASNTPNESSSVLAKG